MTISKNPKIIEFIHEFGAVTADQISRVFYYDCRESLELAQRHLAEIVTRTNIKRKRFDYSHKYIYYEKEAQLRHKYLVAEFYVKLLNGPGNILEFENHYTIADKHPDFFAAYEISNKVHLFFGEIQISSNALNMKKYDDIYDSGEWRLPVLPKIVVVSDRKWHIKSKLDFVVIPTSFEGWERIFESPGD